MDKNQTALEAILISLYTERKKINLHDLFQILRIEYEGKESMSHIVDM
jgi:hypothetical protein